MTNSQRPSSRTEHGSDEGPASAAVELNRAAECDVSVVVPAYNASATLPQCVESVLRQDFSDTFEIVVVASADRDADLPRLEGDPRVRVMACVPRLGAAAARNRGASVARGSAIVFVDADVVLAGDCLRRLQKASSGSLGVAGSVANGTPDSLVGSAEYLMQFIDLHPNRKRDSVHFGATCNLLLPRALWEAAGPFPEDMDGGEDTLLTTELRRRGLFTFEPGAVVHHINRTRFTVFLRHQFEFGRFSARLARMGPGLARSPLRQALQRHAVLAPVAAAAKVCWVYRRALQVDRRLLGTAVKCAPLILCGVAAWSAGLVTESARGRPGGEPPPPGGGAE